MDPMAVMGMRDFMKCPCGTEFERGSALDGYLTLEDGSRLCVPCQVRNHAVAESAAVERRRQGEQLARIQAAGPKLLEVLQKILPLVVGDTTEAYAILKQLDEG
jgi:hypothetical protein